MLEPLDPPDPETLRETAFASPPFTWHDRPLAPLAIDREGDWLLHCRRIGLPPLAEVLSSSDLFAPHALRLLWFCLHEPSDWLSVWMAGGKGAPIHLDTRIRAWAAGAILPGEQSAAVSLALQVYDRAYTNRATPVDDDPGEEDAPGKAPGPSGERNTSASSRGPAPASSAKLTSATSSRRKGAGPTSTRTSPRRASSTNGPTP